MSICPLNGSLSSHANHKSPVCTGLSFDFCFPSLLCGEDSPTLMGPDNLSSPQNAPWSLPVLLCQSPWPYMWGPISVRVFPSFSATLDSESVDPKASGSHLPEWHLRDHKLTEHSGPWVSLLSSSPLLLKVWSAFNSCLAITVSVTLSQLLHAPPGRQLLVFLGREV